MTSLDNPERPYKRQRLESVDGGTTQLPQDVLLLSLPHLLIHPPTHKYHSRSLYWTLFALRKCLTLPNLDTTSECRAWTELAEVGLRIGLREPGIENEVAKAISKALMIANKHPSLRMYKPQISYLSARLAAYQGNTKHAQNTLKKVLTHFLLPPDPPHIIYSAHLAYITSHSIASRDEHSPSYSLGSSSQKVLGAVHELYDLAVKNQHPQVARLAMVLELRDLMQNGAWTRAEEVLKENEDHFGLTFEANPTKHTPILSALSIQRTKLETVLIVHILIIGVLYHTYAGDSTSGYARLKQLHHVLDSGALDAFGTHGIVDIDIPHSPPLRVQVTHPRVIFALGFLVSSISKRDPVGRKPKRRLFANEGIVVVDKELKKEISLPLWASLADVRNFQNRMNKIKADMMCELIGLCIQRSEFTDAEHHLAQVIAHTRTSNLFSLYSARITLHQAHLAHSLGQTARALKCYLVAAKLSRRRPGGNSASDFSDDQGAGCDDYWVNVSARAGEIWLRLGVLTNSVTDDEEAFERKMKSLRKSSEELTKECEGLGGTLKAVGAIISAVLSTEFLDNKAHLRVALQLTTSVQDNYLRALVLALIAAQYLHTSTDHAEAMLTTAEQLAAGLGAQPRDANQAGGSTKDVFQVAYQGTDRDGVGNANLRLWIGERMLELKRRVGDEEAASKQRFVNAKLRKTAWRLLNRKISTI